MKTLDRGRCFCWFACFFYLKVLLTNSLKILKGYSESVNRRRTDNKVAKRKRTNNNLQNIHIKTKDRETRTSLKVGGELGCTRRVCSSCATSCTHRVNIVCQWLLTGWWFSPVSSLNKTDRHDITVIFLKVVLNTISLAFRIYILMKSIY